MAELHPLRPHIPPAFCGPLAVGSQRWPLFPPTPKISPSHLGGVSRWPQQDGTLSAEDPLSPRYYNLEPNSRHSCDLFLWDRLFVRGNGSALLQPFPFWHLPSPRTPKYYHHLSRVTTGQAPSLRVPTGVAQNAYKPPECPTTPTQRHWWRCRHWDCLANETQCTLKSTYPCKEEWAMLSLHIERRCCCALLCIDKPHALGMKPGPASGVSRKP
jgi:hypothetical protein|mmetsp:Transcript_7652/g.14618  ORF Transcript_7652/g.14618 Transcript_7652/m.14618 type:complete len:214 (+) Transcript_7652:1738-2379(+)